MRTNRPRTEPLEILTFNDHVDKHELKRKLRNRKVVGKPVGRGREGGKVGQRKQQVEH